MPLGIVSEFDYLKEIQNQDEKESNQESGSIIEESVPESDSDSDQELNTRASESDIESESEVRMPNSDIDSGPISAFIKQLPKLGRQEGSTQVPDSLRKIIGESVIEEGSQHVAGDPRHVVLVVGVREAPGPGDRADGERGGAVLPGGQGKIGAGRQHDLRADHRLEPLVLRTGEHDGTTSRTCASFRRARPSRLMGRWW